MDEPQTAPGPTREKHPAWEQARATGHSLVDLGIELTKASGFNPGDSEDPMRGVLEKAFEILQRQLEAEGVL